MQRSSRLFALAMLLASPAAHPPARASTAEVRPGDLDDRLVRMIDGRLAPARLPPDVRRIVFYFGASWCGPCRAFVPELRAAYPKLRARGVEIVFVSDDIDCRRMESYVAQARMPWPVVACRHRERLGTLQRARGETLPGMLVYDATGAQVLTSWTQGGASRPRETLARLLTSTR